MKTLRYRRYGLVMVLAMLLCVGFGGKAMATSSSAHYSVNEVQFGPGSSLNDCSTHYCAKTSAGDTVAGSSSSAHYSALSGFNTTNQPLLEVTVTGGSQNMGTLDATHTGTATNLIKVRSYLSNGYTVQVSGATPSQGTHHLTALASPTTSHQGAEQFGINLVANTAPAIGSNPVQVPSGTFSFGTVTSDYSSADLFKYSDGDTVAQSTTSSGETDYTMSLIINVSNVTPGGNYTGTYAAVVVPTY